MLVPSIPALIGSFVFLCVSPANTLKPSVSLANDELQTAPTAKTLQASAVASNTWQSQLGAQIRRQEYDFSHFDSEFWSAPNRAEELRTRLNRDGLEVFPRETDASGTGAAWKLRIKTVVFGRTDHAFSVPSHKLVAVGAHAEIDHEALLEWFVNSQQGIEQGWTIDCEPSGSGELVIGLAIEGDLFLQLDENGQAGVFVDATNEPQVHYGKLKAWDATGRELGVRLVASVLGIDVRVDDSSAIYPVTVDPLLTTPSWIVETNNFDSQMGFSVASAGDVNGDGYDDVIVGARRFDNGFSRAGRVFVYHGSATGLSASASWIAESTEANQVGDEFGHSVASAGDVNGDGYDDVIVGVPYGEIVAFNEGRVIGYYGSAAGLSTTESWDASSKRAYSEYGGSVSSAGDVNGDGYDDVIVGARSYNGFPGSGGGAFLYFGSASGLSLNYDWLVEPNQANAFYGHSVASAGDVNGDGYSDIMVGAYYWDNGEVNEGRVYVYYGRAAGPSASVSWLKEINIVFATFGVSVSSAGDVNGDGYDDIIVGAELYSNPNPSENQEGAAYVYYGSASGLGSIEDWQVESNQARARMGSSVSSAGDVNGDGYDDVIIGVPGFTNDEISEGRAVVYHGSPTGLSLGEAWAAEPNESSAEFGSSVANAGDVNGDGFDDVLVGAPLYDTDVFNEGRAYLYLGAADILATEVVRLGVPANPNALIPGVTKRPLVGEVWDPIIDHTTFLPAGAAVLDVFGISLMPVNIPAPPIGTVLCSPSIFTRIRMPGNPFNVQIPNDPTLVGVSLCVSGASFDIDFDLYLTNALDITIGSL